MDLVHLVGQGFVQHPQGENVPLGELVQVGEQPGGGQAPVAGNHTVGAFTPHGQGGPFDVAHRHLQHLFAGAVVNGQGDIDAGDLHIAHDTAAGHVQQLLVALVLLLGGLEPVSVAKEPAVIVLRRLPQGFVGFIVHFRHGLLVGGDGLGLVHGVPVIGYHGVQQQGQPCKKHCQQQYEGHSVFLGSLFLHEGLSLLLQPGEELPAQQNELRVYIMFL